MKDEYEKTLIYKLTNVPRHKWKNKRVFDILFPSFWSEEEDIFVSVHTRRNRKGEYKVTEIEVPENILEEDLEEILLCYWFVFDKKRQSNRKCPPVFLAWEFDTAWVVACQKPIGQKWTPFAKQLKDMENEEKGKYEKEQDKNSDKNVHITKTLWRSKDFIQDVLCRLGSGICTVASNNGFSLEFDITKDDWFGTDKMQHALICAKLYKMFGDNQPVGVLVRTFTNETVSVLHTTENRIICVPIKELRGYRVYIAKESKKGIMLDYEKLSPEELRKCYSYDIIDEQDHRFI